MTKEGKGSGSGEGVASQIKPFADTPLTIAADGSLLIMAIGVERIAYCYEESEDNNPFVNSLNDFVRQWKVESPEQFARDVAKAFRLVLLAEREDGSTPLTDLLDQACVKAIEDGSKAVEHIGGKRK